jgi:hypothetical protein
LAFRSKKQNSNSFAIIVIFSSPVLSSSIAHLASMDAESIPPHLNCEISILYPDSFLPGFIVQGESKARVVIRVADARMRCPALVTRPRSTFAVRPE